MDFVNLGRLGIMCFGDLFNEYVYWNWWRDGSVCEIFEKLRGYFVF